MNKARSCMTILAVLAGGLAWAGVPADAGVVTAVSGQVTVETAGSAGAQPVSAFSRVREGDRLALGDGGAVDVMYYASGQIEHWAGPVDVTVKASGGVSKKGTPTTTEGGPELARSLHNAQVLLNRAELEASGGTVVRGDAPEIPIAPEEVVEVSLARARYEGMRARAAETDVLPEMDLASVLIEYGLMTEAAAVLDRAIARCGSCEAPAKLRTWLEANR